MSSMSLFFNVLLGTFAEYGQEFCGVLEERGKLLEGPPAETGWYYLKLAPGAAGFRYYTITPDHPLEKSPTWKKDNHKRLKFVGPFTEADFLRFVADQISEGGFYE